MSSPIIKTNFIIITGGPGMGKTAIVHHLSELGYYCVPESGRAIIQQQMAEGGDALPWSNPAAFAKLMFNRSLEDYFRLITESAPVFFDRGSPDVIGYLELSGLPVPYEMIEAARNNRYHQSVFITPPWQEIYENDRERKQDFEEAVRTYEMMKSVYGRYGYELVEIPLLPVSDRTGFILDHLASVL